MTFNELVRAIMLRFCLLLLFVLLQDLSVSAQSGADERPVYYGVYGHVLSADHSPDFNELPGFPKAPAQFTDGSGSGFSVGGILDIPLSSFLGESSIGSLVVLGIRGGISVYDGSLETEEPTQFIIDGQPVDGAFLHTIDASFTSLSLEPSLAFAPLRAVQLFIGPSLQFPLSASFSQREDIARPEGVENIGGGRGTELYTDEDIPNTSAVQTAIMIGASVAIPISKTMVVAPEVLHYTSLGSISGDVTWDVSSFRFGLALKMRAAPPKELLRDTLHLRDTTDAIVAGIEQERVRLITTERTLDSAETNEHIVYTTRIREQYRREVPRPKPKLSASLSVRSLAQGSTRAQPMSVLNVEEVVSNKYTPLLNYVFFADSSAAIDRRYRRLDGNAAARFSVDELYSAGTLETYYNLLNIVGARMRDRADASITITGCNANQGAEKANTALSRARAEALRSYLVDTWRIDPTRITLKQRNLPARPSNPRKAEGVAENRRAEITSGDSGLLAPVFTSDTVYQSATDVIRFQPAVNSEAGVSSWRLGVQQYGKTVKEFTGSGMPPAALDWQLDEAVVSRLGAEPLRYSFTVNDRENQEAQAEPGSIPLRVVTTEQKLASGAGFREVERYSLLLFDFDDVRLSRDNKGIIDFIRGRLRDNSRVTIIGTTDAIGEEEYNRDLSLKRARSAARALNVEGAIVEGMGEDTRSFPNELPEGRFYSRTVIIEVENRVE